MLAINTWQFIKQVIKYADIGIFVASMSIIMSTGNIFLYCYVGSSTTDFFHRYADVSFESVWYKFPTKLQQYLRLIIADGHRARIFTGLGIIDLNLILFTRVMISMRESHASHVETTIIM